MSETRSFRQQCIEYLDTLGVRWYIGENIEPTITPPADGFDKKLDVVCWDNEQKAWYVSQRPDGTPARWLTDPQPAAAAEVSATAATPNTTVTPPEGFDFVTGRTDCIVPAGILDFTTPPPAHPGYAFCWDAVGLFWFEYVVGNGRPTGKTFNGESTKATAAEKITLLSGAWFEQQFNKLWAWAEKEYGWMRWVYAFVLIAIAFIVAWLLLFGSGFGNIPSPASSTNDAFALQSQTSIPTASIDDAVKACGNGAIPLNFYDTGSNTLGFESGFLPQLGTTYYVTSPKDLVSLLTGGNADTIESLKGFDLASADKWDLNSGPYLWRAAGLGWGNTMANNAIKAKDWVNAVKDYPRSLFTTLLGYVANPSPCLKFPALADIPNIPKAEEDKMRAQGEVPSQNSFPTLPTTSSGTEPAAATPTLFAAQPTLMVQVLPTWTPQTEFFPKPSETAMPVFMPTPKSDIQVSSTTLSFLANMVMANGSSAVIYPNSCLNGQIANWNSVTFYVPMQPSYVYQVDLSSVYPYYTGGGCNTIQLMKVPETWNGTQYVSNPIPGYPVTDSAGMGGNSTGASYVLTGFNNPNQSVASNAIVPTVPPNYTPTPIAQSITWQNITLAQLPGLPWQNDLTVVASSTCDNVLQVNLIDEKRLYFMASPSEGYVVDASGYGGYLVGKCHNIRVTRTQPADPNIDLGGAYLVQFSQTPLASPTPVTASTTVDIVTLIKGVAKYDAAYPEYYSYPLVACKDLGSNQFLMTRVGDPCDISHAIHESGRYQIDWTELLPALSYTGSQYFGPCGDLTWYGSIFEKKMSLDTYGLSNWCIGPGK